MRPCPPPEFLGERSVWQKTGGNADRQGLFSAADEIQGVDNTMSRWAVAMHGGAGVVAGRSYAKAEGYLSLQVCAAATALDTGSAALDVVQAAVEAMEASGLFVAGRGSVPGRLGQIELDACIMDGRTGRAGAVAALQGYPAPVAVARRVMEASQAVLLVSEGAASFAASQGFDRIPGTLATWLRKPDGFDPTDLDDGHGTVGAVALDRKGRLAAATSTGGVYGALQGRVGDTPVPGAGVWADSNVAVSCTGQGEAFLRVAAAHDLAVRMRYQGADCIKAADEVLAAVEQAGGDGGLIAVTREGKVVAPFNTDGMKRAWATSDGEAWVGSVGTTLRALRTAAG